MSNEVTVWQDNSLTAEGVQAQVNLVQQVMHKVMKNGEHYGTIPGCGPKPTLLKPGAEKLAMTFRLAPKFEVAISNLPGGHREYEIVCSLYTAGGEFVGQGVGCCSTMESKFRYVWKGGERVEHPDPADKFNTVKKISKKRALVDAILTATAASDIFTQDIEEMDPNSINGDDKPKPKPKMDKGAAAADKKKLIELGAKHDPPMSQIEVKELVEWYIKIAGEDQLSAKSCKELLENFDEAVDNYTADQAEKGGDSE